MSIAKKIYDPDLQTDRAKNIKGDVVYIDVAESGRKNYFCLGCGKEMEAVKRKKNPNHKSYFRHIPVDVSKGEKPCVFSNREYREIIASDILQRIKRIKVPALYKFPSKKEEGYPNLIDDSKHIQAHKVRSEVTFYEDESGNIHFGKNPQIENRYHLMRPDVVFFNQEDEPILFIELVVTHKITDEKKIKLRRIGIDTISVKIPKSSDQDIERAFNITKHTKWEFSEKESNTKYVPTSEGDSEGVLEFDKEQRDIFIEGYRCRKSRITNTIRSIGRSLETESYRNIEQQFRRELSRIEEATKREREELDVMEKQQDSDVFSSFRGAFEQLENEERGIHEEEEEFRVYKAELDRRYHTKIKEIRIEQHKIEQAQAEASRNTYSEESVRDKFEFDKRVFRTDFEFRKEKILQDIDKEEADLGRIIQLGENIKNEFGDLTRRAIRDFEQETNSIRLQDENYEGIVNESFRRELEQIASTLPKRIRALLEIRRLGDDFKNLQREENRIKRARKFFVEGTWKRE